MITRENIEVRQFYPLQDASAVPVPIGMCRVVAKCVLSHEMMVDERAVPQFSKELKEGMENKLKDAILREIYGDIAKKLYEKRAEILLCVPSSYLFRATEAFNDILDLLPNHAQYSIPEWMGKGEINKEPHDL